MWSPPRSVANRRKCDLFSEVAFERVPQGTFERFLCSLGGQLEASGHEKWTFLASGGSPILGPVFVENERKIWSMGGGRVASCMDEPGSWGTVNNPIRHLNGDAACTGALLPNLRISVLLKGVT